MSRAVLGETLRGWVAWNAGSSMLGVRGLSGGSLGLFWNDDEYIERIRRWGPGKTLRGPHIAVVGRL